MNKVSFTLQSTCPACGNAGQVATISREKGMGAELLISCPACGNEVHADMSEQQALQMSAFAQSQAPEKLQ